jgi:hypothetical protein
MISVAVIVPTEVFLTRRVRWMLHRALPDYFGIRVIALDPLNLRQDNWRHSETGAAFKTEIVKYLY